MFALEIKFSDLKRNGTSKLYVPASNAEDGSENRTKGGVMPKPLLDLVPTDRELTAVRRQYDLAFDRGI